MPVIHTHLHVTAEPGPIPRGSGFFCIAGTGKYHSRHLKMREFRVFVLTRDGTILSMHHLQCETVEQAEEVAKGLAVTHTVELWDPPVRVARFEPETK